MAKKKAKHLGKGLQALLGPIETESQIINQNIPQSSSLPSDSKLEASLNEIILEQISPNPYQPRQVWNEEELSELVNSIKANGVIQPIILRKMPSGYQIIAGERRWRASKIAELKTIPAMVREASEAEMLELALVENIHRSNLNPIERATAYRDYIDQFKLTQSQASERLGENRSVIANHLRLLDLPEEIKTMVISRELSMGHARAILSLPNDELRKKLANRALAGRLSVRDVEKLVKKYLAGETQEEKKIYSKPPHIMDLEDKLRQQLGTKVSIQTRKSGDKGKIVIEFLSLDEFDRLTEKIGLDSID